MLLYSSLLNAQMPKADSFEVPHNNFVKKNAIFFDALSAKMHGDNKKCTHLLQQFLLIDTTEGAVYYELAKINDGDNKTELALYHIRKALQTDTNNKWYASLYAALLAREGNFALAAQIMDIMLSKTKGDGEYYDIASDYFQRAGNYNKALLYIDKALLENNNDDVLVSRKVEILSQSGDKNKLLKYLEQLLQSDPQNTRYMQMVAQMNRSEIRMTDSQQVAALKLQSTIGKPCYDTLLLAYKALQKKDTSTYHKMMRRALSPAGGDPDAKITFFSEYIAAMPTVLLRQEALPLLNTWLDASPATLPYRLSRATLYTTLNETALAAEDLKFALTLKVKTFNLYERLLKVYATKQYADSLLTYALLAERLYPINTTVKYYKATAYYFKEDLKAAENTLKKTIEDEEDGGGRNAGQMYALLGDVYYKLNDKPKALENWKKAKEKGYNTPMLLKKISDQKLYE
ncbi:MAG: hypothetical protein EBX41_01885 [Chitinophagia bacterium]|nr:hypothetical protein [Chitinophagia bacterium]